MLCPMQRLTDRLQKKKNPVAAEEESILSIKIGSDLLYEIFKCM